MNLILSLNKFRKALWIGFMAVLFAGVYCSRTGFATDSFSFQDDDGRTISASAPFTRIVSLYSAHTENLYDLGAGASLIGAHKTSTYPAAAAFLPRYDYNADPEKLIAAEPDLVLIRPFIARKAPAFVQALEMAGITVVSLYPEKFDNFDDYIRKLAMLSGTQDKAEAKLIEFHRALEAISSRTTHVERRKVYFESTDTNMRTVTPDSMAAIAIRLAGGINIADGVQPLSNGSSIAAFGAEKILNHADEIDVYVSQRGAMNAGGNAHTIRIRPGFGAIKAVQEGRVFVINEKIISSPTFRYTSGVQEMARFLYPDLMDDVSQWRTDDMANKRDFANIIVRITHLPIYTTFTSSYYEEKHRGHVYGMFADVPWTDADFNEIETAAMGGYIDGETDRSSGLEYFNPDAPVTRQALAKAIFIQHDFPALEKHLPIQDLDQCAKPNIVQTLIDHAIFDLKAGHFEPDRNVTRAEIIDAYHRAAPFLTAPML